MRRSHERTFQRKAWVRRGAMLVMVALLVLLGSSVWSIFQKYREAHARKEDLALALRDLEKREAELKLKVDALNTERGVETEIRSKFQVAREGEGVIYLVQSEESNAPSVPEENAWRKMLSWFGF